MIQFLRCLQAFTRYKLEDNLLESLQFNSKPES